MKSRESELIFLFLFIDLIILNITILFTAGISNVVSSNNFHEMSDYLLHGNLAWIITYFLLSNRNLFLRDGFFNRFKRITQRVVIFLMVSLTFAYLLMPKTYSRYFLFEYTLAFYLGKLTFYFFLYNYLNTKRKKGIHVKRAIIIGINETSLLLRQLIDSNPMLGYKFLGYLENEENQENSVSSESILGKIEELESIIKSTHIETIFVSVSFFNGTKEIKDLLTICNQNGIRLRFLPVHQQWFRNRINMESIEHLVVINPQEIPLDNIESQFFKRMFDILFSLFVIIFFFTWLFPIIAIAIKLTSKGPVLFVQKRTGINNRTFGCLKFRSMCLNDEADEKQATQGDSRITSVGKILRKYNLDELPQFFNVLIGQMSIVGPRPHMLKHTEQYSKLIEHYMIRHYVKPGITGWAQVNGYRGETDELWKMEKRVTYDMCYIENWNLAWDLEIIIKTVFGRKGFMNAG